MNFILEIFKKNTNSNYNTCQVHAEDCNGGTILIEPEIAHEYPHFPIPGPLAFRAMFNRNCNLTFSNSNQPACLTIARVMLI